MNNTIIFLSLLVLFFSIMLKIDISILYDMMSNKVIILLRVFGVKIIQVRLDVIGLSYEINNNKKLRKLNGLFSKENNYLILEIKKNILDKLYYGKVSINTELGIGGASVTAVYIGIIDILCFNLSNLCRSRDIDFRYSNKPIFDKNTVKLGFDITIYFTIFDMAFALLYSFYKRSRYVKKQKSKKLSN